MPLRQFKVVQSITNRNKILDQYFEEVSKEKLVTAEEEVLLAQRIRMGDKEAEDKLTKANLRFVVTVAKQYEGQGLALPDLINEGNLGLIIAVKRFDETRGFKLISYAIWWIRQSILQAIAEQSKIVRLPMNKISCQKKITRISSEFEMVNERLPSNEEIAEILEISEPLVDEVQKFSLRYLSLDIPLKFESEDTLLDILKGDCEDTDDGLIRESCTTEIQRSLSTLSEKERSVVIRYYGIGGTTPMTLEEIGRQDDMTRERVRQIKEKAIRRLKHSSRSNLLKQYLNIFE